jgi:PII-like signaling protein
VKEKATKRRKESKIEMLKNDLCVANEKVEKWKNRCKKLQKQVKEMKENVYVMEEKVTTPQQLEQTQV